MDGRTDRQMDWQTFAFIELRIYEAYFIDKSNPFFHSVIETPHFKDCHHYLLVVIDYNAYLCSYAQLCPVWQPWLSCDRCYQCEQCVALVVATSGWWPGPTTLATVTVCHWCCHIKNQYCRKYIHNLQTNAINLGSLPLDYQSIELPENNINREIQWWHWQL